MSVVHHMDSGMEGAVRLVITIGIFLLILLVVLSLPYLDIRNQVWLCRICSFLFIAVSLGIFYLIAVFMAIISLGKMK